MNINVNPVGICAAEIGGLDCSQPFDAEELRAVQQAYRQYPVLIFRNQNLSAPQLAAFGRNFGRLEGYGTPQGAAPAKPPLAALRQTDERKTPDQMLYLSPDDPDVLVMTNEVIEALHPIGIVDNAEMWHSDASHKPEPYQAIIVHVLQNPTDGGDTEFCDMREMYDVLTPQLKAALEGRNAIHHWSKSRNPRFMDALDAQAKIEGERIAAMIPEIAQPIVRTHPDSGRRSLYLSPRFTLRIDGVVKEHSDALLNGIFALADDRRFIYRHVWRERDLMIWDNRCLNHRVQSYPAQDVRRRHRVTVSGDRPFFSKEYRAA